MSDDAATARRFLRPSLSVHGHLFEWGTRTYVMAIVNVTPDSFSGDGTGADPERAAALARRFEAEGADIIDLGAESSRPGGEGVDAEEEMRRLLPALAAVRAATDLPVSVDTWRTETAEAALAAGADVINDIHGLRKDPGMAALVARTGVPAVAMHNQRGFEVTDVIGDIEAGFRASLAAVRDAGGEEGQLILDPGFGFGWTPEENLEMVRRLPELSALGLPLLIGMSRKSTLGAVLDAPVDQRLEATLGAVALAVAGGVDVVRVHDVKEVSRAVRVADAIVRGTWQAAR